jgi:hypothetical protein
MLPCLYVASRTFEVSTTLGRFIPCQSFHRIFFKKKEQKHRNFVRISQIVQQGTYGPQFITNYTSSLLVLTNFEWLLLLSWLLIFALEKGAVATSQVLDVLESLHIQMNS